MARLKLRCLSKRRGVNKTDGEVISGTRDLSSDLMHDILSRLPIKSIVRCRSVCQNWYGLTQDPLFIKLHLDRTNNHPSQLILQPLSGDADRFGNSLVLLDIENCKATWLPFKEFQLNDLKVMCSCNGLLCMAPRNRLDPLVICNPITGKVTWLCVSRTTRQQLRASGTTRQRRELLNHQVALVFDPSSQKYKVLRAYKFRHQPEITWFEIMTLGKQEWRRIRPPCGTHDMEIWRPVIWNHAIHWRVSWKDDYKRHECILSFDVREETFQMISFPKTFSAYLRPDLELLVLEEHLTLVQHENSEMKIWKVRGDKDGGYALCYEQTYDTHVAYGGCFSYATVCRSDDKSYLLQVSYGTTQGWLRRQKMHTHFVKFFPEMARYIQVDIPGLPEHFESVCFKPSFAFT